MLRLDHCRFQGPIPRELFLACTNLEVVLLNNNTLSDEIPRTVGHCKQLTELDFHANFLTGSVPCVQLKVRREEALRTISAQSPRLLHCSPCGIGKIQIYG